MTARVLLAAVGALVLLAFALVDAGSARRPRPKPHKHKPAKTVQPAPRPPEVVTENDLAGTPGWLGPLATGRAAEVYASATDAKPGDSVSLYVSTAGGARYRILVYRLGRYAGVGAREVACLPSCGGAEQGVQQPMTNSQDLHAGWPTTDVLSVDPSWVSGYYLIRVLLLDGPQPGNSATTYLIVNSAKPDTRMLVQVPVNTWQAYNPWGGRSTYDLPGLARRANHVSFDRPYAWDGSARRGRSAGRSRSCASSSGAATTSATSRTSTRTLTPSRCSHIGSLQLPATPSTGRRRCATRSRPRVTTGVNLAFVGANDAYWQVRLENDGRMMVAYKSRYDPNPDGALKTTMFRDLTPPRLECTLIGIQHQGASPLYWKQGDYTVPPGAVADPWMRNTGFLAGAVVRGVVSVETDMIPGTETAAMSCGHPLTVFFHRELGGDKDGNADAIRYTATSGSYVFASGSHQFSWGLDGFSDVPGQTRGLVDPRLQQFMRNALDAMTQ